MSVSTSGGEHQGPAGRGAVLEQLDEAECLRLISAGGVGRLAYTGRYGLTIFPVNYKLHDGAIVFRTGQDSPTGEDLETGIEHAEYQVAFEIDAIDLAAHEGWSVLIHGPAHHMTTDAERAWVEESGVQPWGPGPRERAIRIKPTLIAGRRLRRS